MVAAVVLANQVVLPSVRPEVAHEPDPQPRQDAALP